jgi:hypothetical protein
MQVSLGTILLFVLQYGETSELQDGIGGGCRIDCGCGGQSYKKGADGIRVPNSFTNSQQIKFGDSFS